MYFLNLHKLAQELRARTVYPVDTVNSFLGLLAECIFRITPFNFIPLIYQWLFGYIQRTIANAVQLPTLQLKVYHTIDDIYPIILGCISLSMILFFYLAYKNNDSSYFVDRAACLNFAISVRIMLVTSVLFLSAVAYAGFYFSSKLMVLTQIPELGDGWLNSLYRLADKLNVIGKLWAVFTKLRQAEAIFEQINLWSWYFYWTSQAFSIFSMFWYFCAMKKYLAKSQ